MPEDFPYTYFLDHPSLLSTTREVIDARLPKGQRLTVEQAQAIIVAEPEEPPPAPPTLSEIVISGTPSVGDVPTFRGGLWVPEPAVTGGLEAEEDPVASAALVDAIADWSAALSAHAAGDATDAELAAAVSALEAAIALKQDASTAATDAELASALATVTSALALKQDAATAATDAEVTAAIAAASPAAVLLDEQVNADVAAAYTLVAGGTFPAGGLVYDATEQGWLRADAASRDLYLRRNDKPALDNVRNPLVALEVRFGDAAAAGNVFFEVMVREQGTQQLIVQVFNNNLVLIDISAAGVRTNRLVVGTTTLQERAWLIGGVFHNRFFGYWSTFPPALSALGLAASGVNAKGVVDLATSGLEDWTGEAKRGGKANQIRMGVGTTQHTTHRIYRHVVLDLDKLPLL
jgi:hypothetical protein